MQLIEAIRSRRSVRAYTERVVDEATLRALLVAAVQAPSAVNGQPWRFSIVQGVEHLKRYSDLAKSTLRAAAANDHHVGHFAALLDDPTFNIFYDAGTLVVIGVESHGPFSDADCWLAAENLMLAACDRGLGSCTIGFAVSVLNTAEVKAELGLPASGVAIAPIILGYPRSAPDPVQRSEPQVVCWKR